MKDWIIEKLDKKKHVRENFNCGVDVLNAYLQTRANQEQNKWLNVTYVATTHSLNKENKKSIAGYYTLSNSSLVLSSVKPEFTRDIPPTYDIPAIKIGRLAVDVKYQNQGVGSLLLKNAFLRIIEIAALSGVRVIEVVAKNEDAVQFYKKFGFVQLADAANLLFLPTSILMQVH